MNIPFTPASFRKLDILQQLMEYERHKNEKSLWNGVKAVLIWAASVRHQHLGSFIGTNHVKDALKYCKDEGFMSEEERERLYGSSQHILESLPVYLFGDEGKTENPKEPNVKINRNGVLAGRLLVETRFLQDTFWRYEIWILVWWFILALAFILLLTQTYEGVKKVISTSDNEQHHQMQLNRHRPFFIKSE